ncbi:hypothetical protein [Stenotrophomonas sp. Iso1]|uniref:hypothetical protein n=1 Tax=Stenotrophomonas sp. Iso1 TaxID=2977283 RepID=UPI0022B7C52F|nr:hypothetical protein [Stenotrophomonas sp. Iso1]
MNAKSLALAIALAAGFASTAQASDIVTLDTVQVRPSADQLVQANLEATSSIPTLAAVQVRPTVGQIVELMAEQAANQLVAATPIASVANWVVSLPAVTVRPDVQQVQALAAELAADAVGNVVAKGLVSY